MSWVRQLVNLFGVTWFAITTILTVFMAGIALGSLAVGRLVDRRRVDPLLLFAGLELFLGLYAQAFPWLLGLVEGLYVSVASRGDPSVAAHSALRFGFALCILAAPTVASGATLPAACKAFVRQRDRIGRGVAGLYGANVVGAAVGCFATTFLLIGLFGFPVTAWIGTGANLAAAALAVAARRLGGPARAIAIPSPRTVWHRGAAVVAAAYFTVGFCALGGELLWTRVYSQFNPNPSTAVFGVILTAFLLGHAAGASLLFPALHQVVRPRRLFVGLLVLMGLSTPLAVLDLFIQVDPTSQWPLLSDLGVGMPTRRVWLLLPAIVVPAMASGALFPLASTLTIRRVHGVATGVGTLAALSTVGGILGSLATGYWLMPLLGAVRCLVVVAALPLLAAVWARWALAGAGGGRALAVPLVASMLVIVAGASLAARIPPHVHLGLNDGDRVLSFHEGRNTSSAVVEASDGIRRLAVHGEFVGSGGSDLHLAGRLHPSPRRVVVIGAGAGQVVLQALLQRSVEDVWAVDLDGMMPVHFPLMLRTAWLDTSDERMHFVENDGRHFLLTSDGGFDIVANDAAVYAFYLELSTLELNRLVRSRLADEGLYVTRLHLDRITEETMRREMATFMEVFPNAAFWRLDPHNGMLVGRNGEQPVDRCELPTNDLAPPELWYDADQMRRIAAGAPLITDDHPLHLPRAFRARAPVRVWVGVGDQ